jgi:hypothetical protein
VLAEEPTCRLCTTPSAIVDHVVPLAKGGSTERDNLQALCESCHREKTRGDHLPVDTWMIYVKDAFVRPSDRDLVDESEIAARLGVSVDTLHKHQRAVGFLQPEVVPGKVLGDCWDWQRVQIWAQLRGIRKSGTDGRYEPNP